MRKTIAIMLTLMILAVPTLSTAENAYVSVMRTMMAEGRAVSAHGQIEAGDFASLIQSFSSEAEANGEMYNGITALLNAISFDAAMNNDMSDVTFDLKLSGQSALSAEVQLGEEGMAVQSDWLGEKPLFVSWDSITQGTEGVQFDVNSLKEYPAHVQNYLDLLGTEPDAMAGKAMEFMPKTAAFVQDLLDNAFSTPATEHFADSDTASIRKDLYLTAADFSAFMEAVKADMKEIPYFSSMMNNPQFEESMAQTADVPEELENRVIPVIVWLDNANQIVRIDADLNPQAPAEEEAPAAAPATGTDLPAAKSAATQTSLGETNRKDTSGDVVINESGEQAADVTAADGHLIYAVMHEGETVLRSLVMNGIPSSQTVTSSQKATNFSVMQQAIGSDQHIELYLTATDDKGEKHPMVQANLVVSDLSRDNACEIRADLSFDYYSSLTKLVATEDGYVYEVSYADEPFSFQVVSLMNGETDGQNAQFSSETQLIIPSFSADPIMKFLSSSVSTDRLESGIDTANVIRPAEMSQEEANAFSQELTTNVQTNLMKLIQLLPEESLSLLSLFMR